MVSERLITYLDLAELTSASVPFNRTGWIFELKYDGFRMLAASRDGNAELISRRGIDYTDRFPEIADDLSELPEAVLDAELVIVDQGTPAIRSAVASFSAQAADRDREWSAY